jgi:DNA-binding response OmpR family regulator
MTPPTQALATPILDEVPTSRARDPDAAAAPNRVLVLDVDGERQDLLADVVTRAGGVSRPAGSGAAAVEILLDDEHLQLVLVAGLPDGSPRGFVSWARPRHPDLAIVAVARNAAEATDLYNAGADVVTSLPLDPDLLGAELAAALRRVRRSHLQLVGGRPCGP